MATNNQPAVGRRQYPIGLLILGLFFLVPPANADKSLADAKLLSQAPSPPFEERLSAATAPETENQIQLPSGSRPVRIGLYENKPKIFTAADGRAAGIFAGIIEEVAKQENWQLIFVPSAWTAALAALERGQIDLMPDVAFSPERKQFLDFHQEEVLESWSQIYTHPKKPVKNWSDLHDLRLALFEDSIQQTTLERILRGLGCENSIIKVDSYEKAFTLTARGEADAVAANNFFGNYFYQDYDLERTALVFNAAPLFFAASRGRNADLLTAIDRHLRTMKNQAGSVYYRELGQWLEKPAQKIVPPYLLWIIGAVFGALLLALTLILLLRAQVQKRTRHLLRANEKLRASEEKFRRLFQDHNAVKLKLLIDPENGRIVDANPAAAGFYGCTTAKLRQMNMQEINTLSPEQIKAEMAEARKSHRNYFKFRHRLADGESKNMEVFSSPIALRGKTLLYCIIHDISAQQKLEEQFHQAQKMESIGQLAGGVAHDFNNMLGIIIGYAEIALGEVKSTEPLHEDLEKILNAAQRAAEITRQLPAFARKQMIKPQVLDLNKAVENILKMLRRLIGEDIDLVWRPGAGTWPILMDPTQIDQILANLCVNARDAIASVGKLTIETRNVTLTKTIAPTTSIFPPETSFCWRSATTATA